MDSRLPSWKSLLLLLSVGLVNYLNSFLEPMFSTRSLPSCFHSYAGRPRSCDWSTSDYSEVLLEHLQSVRLLSTLADGSVQTAFKIQAVCKSCPAFTFCWISSGLCMCARPHPQQQQVDLWDLLQSHLCTTSSLTHVHSLPG